MGSGVAITGLGLITPLGGNVAETWNSLLAGESIRNHARLLGYSNGTPRAAGLAIAAASQAVQQAGWNPDLKVATDTGLVIATSKGPIESWIGTKSLSSDNLRMGGETIPECDAFGLAEIAHHVRNSIGGMNGPSLTISAACASGLVGLIRGVLMIRSGDARRVLVVATEAAVHPLFIASFQRLAVLPNEGVPCRPFDMNRQGFLMSEAAAAVCIEICDEDDRRPLTRIDRFALAADATHITGSDPDGKVLGHVLDQVIDRRSVDFIHAHGTGTLQNDPMELAAIEKTLKRLNNIEKPILYSHKAALGHSQGAAGLVAIVINCLCHIHNCVPGNVNTLEPMGTRHMIVQREKIARKIRRSISCASGFGGVMAAVGLNVVYS